MNVLKFIYRIWRKVGLAIGAAVSWCALILFYYAVMTPIGLVFKLRGRDPLALKKDSTQKTYWRDHPEMDKESYRHLF